MALPSSRWPSAVDSTAGVRVSAPAAQQATGGTILSSLNRGQRVIDTTATLVQLGEITASELAEHLGITRYDAHAVLNRMNKRTKAGLKRIYVVRYADDHEGARKYPRAVYALGDKRDARKPVADQLAVKRRYYARLKSRTTMNSVFNLGMHWRAGTNATT